MTTSTDTPQVPPTPRAKDAVKLAVIIIVISSIFRLAYMLTFGLVPDEAYYWDWSRYLSWGYFDHPPMVAWLTAASTALAGDTLLGVRLVPWACGAVTLVVATLLTRKFCTSSGSIGVLLVSFHVAVISGIGMLLLTPDAPFICLWALALLVAYRAVFEPFRGVWIVLGLVCGLGLMSKYTFVLFFASGIAFLLVSKDHRRLLWSARLWSSVVIAGLVFLPNIMWNASHAWVSYLFQAGHGLKGKGWPRLDLLGEYVGGQVGLITPLLAAMVGIAAYRAFRIGARDSRLRFLCAYLIVPIAAFGMSSLGKRVEPNWPAAAYVAGFVLVAWLWESGGKGVRIWIVASLIVAGVATSVLMAHISQPFLPLPAKSDPSAQIRGWKELGVELGAALATHDSTGAALLCANRYQDAALLAFYTPNHPRTTALNLFSRPNHYDLLYPRDVMEGRLIVYVNQLNDRLLEKKLEFFSDVVVLDTLELRRSSRKTVEHLVVRGVFRPSSGDVTQK